MKYAPPGDPVFDLVPYEFALQANAVWTAMGSPQPSFDNAWEIYLHMRAALRAVTVHETLQQILSNVSTTCEPLNCLDEIPEDFKPTADDEDLLVMDDSDDEGRILNVNLTDEEHSRDNDSVLRDGRSIGSDFL